MAMASYLPIKPLNFHSYKVQTVSDECTVRLLPANFADPFSRFSLVSVRKPFRVVAAMGRSTEKEKESESEPNTPELADTEVDGPLYQEASLSGDSKPELLPSGVDKIELQARSAIDRLKDVLYKLKTRTSSSNTASLPGRQTLAAAAPETPVLDKGQEVYISQTFEVDLSGSDSSAEALEAPAVDETDGLASDVQLQFHESGVVRSTVQMDSITCTDTTVQFDDETKTAIVTITATVREADLKQREGVAGGDAGYTERAVAMATRALTRACLALDEKAQNDLSTASPVYGRFSVQQSQCGHILSQLAGGTVQRWQQMQETPFRQLYEVTLLDNAGQKIEAIFKPAMEGDKYGRWKRAPPEWVAYHVSSLLGMDTVPPAVIREGLTLGTLRFDSGVMIYKVVDLRPLIEVNPSLWGAPPVMATVSGAHVLDALLGSAARKQDAFLAGRHWTGSQEIRPVLLEHPMGPGHGEMHSLWARRGRFSVPNGINYVDPSILSRLRSLNRSILFESLGGVLDVDEMDTILERRTQVVDFFDSMAARLALL